LFDILNSIIKYNGEKEYTHVFKNLDFQVELLNDCIHFFESLQLFDARDLDITNRIKFISGWKITISSVLKMWNFLESKGFNFLPIRKLDQDSLENLFGKIREKGGNSLNPTSISFIKSFNTLLCHNFLNTGHENCEEDFDILMQINDLKNFEANESNEEIDEIANNFTSNDDTDYQKLKMIKKNSIRYISRYLIKECLSQHTCSVCKEYSIRI